MKTLNKIEMNDVSGAGAFADAGTLIGQGIGAIVDACSKGTEGASSGAALGKGIGAVVDAGFGYINNFFNSLFGKK